MDNFGDPEYLFHQGSSRVLGLIALRLANPAILPHNYTRYSQALFSYLTEIEAIAKARNISLNTAELSNALNDFQSLAKQIEGEKESLWGLSSGDPSVMKFNDRLIQTERSFLGSGLPGRPFYKHVVQAPGLYKGYGADIFPGVVRALEDNNTKVAQEQVDAITERVQSAANTLAPPPASSEEEENPSQLANLIVVIISIVFAISLGSLIGYLIWKNKEESYIPIR